MKKLGLFIVPLLLFGFVCIFLFKGLFSDPRDRESSLIQMQVPNFSLPDVMDPSINYGPDIFQGQVTLLNVWGTWCVTCAVELPFLTGLRQQGVRILGLYFDPDVDPDFGGKTVTDVQAEIHRMLGQLGNPYQFNLFDVTRDTSLDFGVTGAPETFLIDANGIIRLHHIGDLNARVWQHKFAPVYQSLTGKGVQLAEVSE